ncbi:hypothetical protein [Bacillus sp. ISL-45]|uniref:hypothetical protein n=1 Tax=Bacillus sp. ISL-45 TaxID=2819128 RepID=UPI001BEC544E|nr:hypothetical protein [Bacillus sp. ISL-45]MBT2661455.1 hypothetical protein [Bacillus sp. ISL-45]
MERLQRVDINKTKAYYEKQSLITEEWDSDLEQNYDLACETFPHEVKDFFNSLGIDPHKQGKVNQYKEIQLR